MQQFYGDNLLIFVILFIWSLFWKGIALWKSSKYEQKIWFIAILVLNTMGLLEIIYLFWFAKKRFSFKEIKSWNLKIWERSPSSKN